MSFYTLGNKTPFHILENKEAFYFLEEQRAILHPSVKNNHLLPSEQKININIIIYTIAYYLLIINMKVLCELNNLSFSNCYFCLIL